MNKQSLTAATFVTAALMLSGSPASAVLAQEAGDGATTNRERGIVIACHGDKKGLEAYVELYENNLAGNHVQVVLGGSDSGVGNDKWVDDAFRQGKDVRASIRVDGARAVVKGTARKYGPKTPVRESFDDAGYAIEIEGTHKQLRTDLVLRYDGTTVPLTCDDAFVYDLKVTKTPID
jgi:hypothetical protein